MTDDDLRRLPKVLLHEHLDGGLRPATLLACLKARGLPAPAGDAASLAAWFDARAMAGSLPAYLEGFGLTLAAMASPEAMAQVAFEAAEDARAEGCVLAEFRMAPLLLETATVPAEAVVEALLTGLARSTLPCGLILCAMRQAPEADSVRVAELALRYRVGSVALGAASAGVVGFDLAGPEAGYPPALHARALARVRDGGLPITLHAGEADAAERVLEAADHGARRIGHGVRLADWLLAGPAAAERLAAVRERHLHLELCPSSNVHTGAAPSLAAHPIGALWRAGLSLSYHTDNTLMSRTTMTAEARHLLTHQGLQASDLLAMAAQAADASFLPDSLREVALAKIHRAVQGDSDDGLCPPTVGPRT